MKYIDNEEDSEENFVNLCNLIDEQKIKADINEFRLLLHFINVVSSNHYRNKDFISKIEKILLLFREEFNKYLSIEEVFSIFKYDKRIFLFLLENEIVQINFVISNFLKNYQRLYPEYFMKEIRLFVSIQSDLLDDPNYEEKRRIGENDNIICQIIRNDSLDDFIAYVEKNNVPLTQTIEKSIFETNSFLLFITPSLIEYSAFFGSIQIFKYLVKNNVKLTPSLWFYSIHGNNLEIIHILEENRIEFEDKTGKSYLDEAMQSHHFEIINYFKNKWPNLTDFIQLKSLEYYNYIYFPDDLFNQVNFYFFCKYDYFFFVNTYLSTNKININSKFADVIEHQSVILTPLLTATSLDNYEIVKLLLNQPDINVNVLGKMNSKTDNEIDLNALMLAGFNHNLKMINLLLSNGDIDVNKMLVFKYYYNNSIEECEERNILIKAINDENAEMVKSLLSHPDIDVNVKFKSTKYNSNYPNEILSYTEKSALEMTIDKNYIEIAKILLNHPKIDVNCVSRYSEVDEDYNIESSPLLAAIANKNLEIVQLLLSNPNIEINQIYTFDCNHVISEKTALLYGIQEKSIDIIKALLSHPKIDVNQLLLIKKDREERIPPLFSALVSEDTEIISLLLAHKDIDVNLRTVFTSNNKRTTSSLLACAISINKEEIIKLLLNCEDINVNDTVVVETPNESYTKKSLLSFAIDSEHENMLKILLDHPNIDVNVADYIKEERESSTQVSWLLHKAIGSCSIDVITKILDNEKVDVNVRSHVKTIDDDSIVEQDYTTLNIVITQKRLDIVKLLLAKDSIDVNLNTEKKVVYSDGSCDEFQKSSLEVAIVVDSFEIFQILFNYLVENDKLTDNLNELLMMTENESIKSIIYSEIKKRSNEK